MSDLHTRLTAAITARLDVARAAGASADDYSWTVHELDDQEFVIVDGVGWTIASGHIAPNLLEHIASWDPSTAIRVLEALQEELNEHTSYDSRPKCCECGGEYPCRAVQRWARSLGVEVE